MNAALELLALPFVASLLLVGIHCQFGLQVLKRNVVFVDLALAQCAALGATVAFMQGHLPQSAGAYVWSLGFAWGAALLVSLIRYAPPRIPSEALVGVLYVASAAAALLLIEKAPQGAEHLKQILTGSVLTVDADELLRALPLYASVGFLLWLASKRGWLERTGMMGWLADLGFYAAFGLVVTSSVAMAGVLLVFSFLIIPALVGLLWSRTPGRQLLVGCGTGGFAAGAGLLASYALDTSTGATMVCAFALLLGIALFARLMADGRLLKFSKALSAFVAFLFLLSIFWLVVQPRADQPLFDAMEAYWPALRETYFSRQEKEIYADADSHVARYLAEGARLTAMEAKSRWQGSVMDEETIRKISSFQQSYNEMIAGERFVMREMRSRARERLRWPMAVAVVFTVMLLWSLVRRSRKAIRGAVDSPPGRPLPGAQ